jgi:uncharacterized protein YlxP (DUF503 family)
VIADVSAAPNNVVQLPGRSGAPRAGGFGGGGAALMANQGFAGLMVLDVLIPHSESLKDKRQSLRSTLQRLKDAGFSASEVDHHDKWQRAQIAVSIVGRGSGDVERLLDTALRMFESRPELDVSVRQRTVLALSEYE